MRSPLRSSSALVATVVPIFTAPISAGGIGSPRREPEQVADALHGGVAHRPAGFSDSSLWATRLPSGRRPMMSVKVPPRSIQKSQVPVVGVMRGSFLRSLSL